MPPDRPRTASLEAGLAELAADELGDDPPRDVGVDRELVRQLEQAARVDGAVRPSSADARLKPIGRDRIARRDVEAGLGPSSAVESRAGRPARRRSAPARGRRAPAARRAAAAARSARGGRRPARCRRVNRPSSKNGALKSGSPRRRDDLRAAPERDRLVDPDPVAEHHERRRQLGVGPHQRPPRGRRPEADLVRRREVAARRRRDVDQDLRAVEREQLGDEQVPEVLADREPDADPEPRRHRPEHDRPAAKNRRSSNRPYVGRKSLRWTWRISPSSSRAAAMNSRWSADSSTNETTADRPVGRARRASPAAGRRGASRPRRRGPGAGSRSARARGRRRGRRRSPAPRASSSWWRARFASRSPSRGAIWARAMRSGCTRRV